jgi:tellurite resistance protein
MGVEMAQVEVLRAACCLAASDGTIAEREMALLRKIAEQPGVGAASLNAMIERAKSDPGYFQKQFEVMKADPEPAMLTLFGVAICDGELSDDERVVLRYFADKLELSEARFEKLLASAVELLRRRRSSSAGATER